MSQFVDFWKIVTPASRKTQYAQPADPLTNMDDSMNLNSAGYAGFSTTAWFSNLLKGATARLQRYKQYDAMDYGDISRALDIISEEMAASDKRTGLPFIVDYQIEENQTVPDTTVTTIRAALRHWARFHTLNKRVFNVARTMCKYGDCFFRKTSDTKKWEYVDPTRVIGIEINPAGDKVAYHVRPSSFVNSIAPKRSVLPGQSATMDSVEITPAVAMIHFTLSDDMGESAPFGLSILQNAFKDFQKLTMLEDSAIIYRIVRAPERRVFYIDVGNMPPQRVKQYIEGIRNDLRQKRMPNTANAQQTDSQYNAECLALDTKIPLLDGRTLTLSEIIDEYKSGKENWIYSCDPDTGRIVPGEIAWAGVTRKNAEVLKLILDNGESITCTPDHQFPVQGIGFVRADQLTNEMSLIPFNKRWTTITHAAESRDNKFQEGYEQVYDISKKEWIFTHRLVNDNLKLEVLRHIREDEALNTIHHVDFNKHNNDPCNLVLMGSKDHWLYHKDYNKARFDSWSVEKQQKQLESMREGRNIFYNDFSDKKIEIEQNRALAISLANAKAGKKKTVRRAAKSSFALRQRLGISQEIISLVTDKIKTDSKIRRLAFLEWMQLNDEFLKAFKRVNAPTKSGRRSVPSWTYLEVIKDFVKAKTFAELKNKVVNQNHKVVKVEKLKETQHTGCITVGENIAKYHTFSTACGVFVKNSISEDYFFPTTAAGRGSRVETLPGGATWEIPELDYFLNKVFRALRVPSSYMKGQEAAPPGAQFNDGKVGVAYMEERIFANFVMRLQACIEEVFDEQFKTYLAVTGINIDPELFKLSLPEPQNFALYRQAALDTDLISSFKSIADTPYLSARFMLERFLGLTKDDVQMNEAMLKQERAIKDGLNIDVLQQMYDPNFAADKAKIDDSGPPDIGDEGGGAISGPGPEIPTDNAPPEEADTGAAPSDEGAEEGTPPAT